MVYLVLVAAMRKRRDDAGGGSQAGQKLAGQQLLAETSLAWNQDITNSRVAQ